MVISRDRKKILLNKKHTSAVKETNWNFLVIVLSSIMVVIGIPSMISACFSDSMGDWGVKIFLICASVIAFLLGVLYYYIPSTLLKLPIYGFRKYLCYFIGALGVAFFPLTIYYMLTDKLVYAIICGILVCSIYLIGSSIIYFIIPKIRFDFKKLYYSWVFFLILVIFGLVIYLISILNPLILAIIIFGNVCVILDFIFPISMFLMLLL